MCHRGKEFAFQATKLPEPGSDLRHLATKLDAPMNPGGTTPRLVK